MKSSLRLMLFSVAMVLLGFSVRAGNISEEQAKAKAYSFLQNLHPLSGGRRLAPARLPESLHSALKEKSAFYVFNVGEQDGFVIVSADDRARSILGYVDSGSFDVDHIPAALCEMLAIYARQIEMLGTAEAKSDSLARALRIRQRISGNMGDVRPLMVTTWNQGYPYNAYCPTLGDQTALTGCVATAMAQIAYYYRFPKNSVPSLAAYTSSTNKINVSAWGATTFDWNNMLPNYDGSFTDAQLAAVATLMRYCGQAAKMDYGFSSGAYNGDALYAFTEKLGYSADAEFKSAASYSADGWEDLIYKELRAGRPVYYSALNGDVGCDVEGHAFVIDGYRADGNYFHVNWGWGGGFDGYFNLFALDPGAPQSPATADGWHYQMLALVGLAPEGVDISKLTQDASGSYLITCTDDWNELSANLQAYNGGSFKLTSDISVTTMVGTEERNFSGTFDGQGHTLTVNIESDRWGAAPFNLVDDGTTIKNLKTQGTVRGYAYHSSGLIGGTSNFSNFPITITNCEVAVQINGTEYAGGFIGHAINMQPVFTDCVFSGSINGCHDHGCFVGWKEWESRPVYINCLSIPASLEGESSCDFSHPGNGGSEDHATLTNCYYSFAGSFRVAQGTSVPTAKLAEGSITHALQSGKRNWATGQVWGQQLGTDAVPVLTGNTSKGVYKVSFSVGGQVLRTIYTNSPIGDKMPAGEDFGLANATFTCNGSTFTSTTTLTGDVTVVVTGTAAYAMTLGTPANGSISINNKACMPGMVKKVTAVPANGYVVSAITVTDASGKALPVTPVSNAANEYVFVFPKSSVTVNAEFTAGEAEPTRFINGGMTLPNWWEGQTWTADTWTIWSHDYQPTLGTPPTDALGHQWYEENYALTNSDADMQPNGNKIVWENHTAPFGCWRNYDYARECGAGDDTPNNFYMRRIFTLNTETVPTKLYLSCRFDDAPLEVYINGTPIYLNNNQYAGDYTAEMTPEQIALIHTDGTPNVLAARVSQGVGDYFIDCGLYDPTAVSYEVTSPNTVRVLRNSFFTGDIVIPEKVTHNGTTYAVTELPEDVTNDLPYITSISLPSTISSLGTRVFSNLPNLQYVKSYIPVYQIYDVNVLVAAPLNATEYEVTMGCSRIWNNAFKFTENLKKLTLPRSLTEIRENVFMGCKALTDIYSYARPVPQTEQNAFEGLDKSKITVHVYASALESYKESWGEDFCYVTIPDPPTITLTIDVANVGSLRTLIEEAAAAKGSTIYDVTGITVTGTINNDDMWTLSQMCTGVHSLGTIDLSGATIEGNFIDNNVFRDKEKLTSIILPETLEWIGDASFHNCDGLTSIDIPASVKSIWSNAFSYCDNLTTVTGLEGLSESNCWEAWDVFYATAITHPVCGGSVFLYMPPSMSGEYEVPAGIKMTTADAIRGSLLSSIILPASLTDLGDDTFRDCPNLTDIYCYTIVPPVCHGGVWEWGFDRGACTVHVPASAVEAYQNADEWRDMGRIVAITTGELVDMTIHVATAGTLNEDFFNSAVAKAQIADKVLIRNLTVTGNLNADDIAYLNTLPNTLYNINLLDLSSATLENNVVTKRMFYSTLYKAIKLPATVSSIAEEAFMDSRRLREITLPASLKYIGEFAFAGSGLASIIIPDAVTDLCHRGLQNCHSLTSITIGNGVTNIPDCWAEYSENLEEVIIGKKVSSISWRAFYGSKLKHVYCYGKNPPSWGNDDAFSDGINADAVLHTYSNSVKRYQNAYGWKDFPTIVGDLGAYTAYNIIVNVATMGTFSDALQSAMAAAGYEDMMDISKLTVTGSINSDDLYYLREKLGGTLDVLDLGAVTVEDNTLGHEALARCGFEEVVLPANIENLQGWYVLEGCVNLKTIDIPSSVKYVGPVTLNGATSLETVTGGSGVEKMDGGNGMYFDNCPNLKLPVILNHFFFRLPLNTEGAYEVPDHVTAIARDGMWHVKGLTALTLPQSITAIYGNAFSGDEKLKDIYFYAVELPYTDESPFNDFDKSSCTLHVYEEMVEVFKANEMWREFNIVGDLGAMPNLTPMNEEDYADLCAIYNTLGGANWNTKWIINSNVQTASRWRGVTFDEDGYVTSINLNENKLSGNISSLTFLGLTRLTSLNLSNNAITGDIKPLAASLPKKCTMYVERQDFGYLGEHTLYELCSYSGLPSIAYYMSQSNTFASTLIGVSGVCQFYHEGTDGGHYWDCYIHADGGTTNNFRFYWPSPATVECFYPHHFTFTYKYEMGDANMDDVLNVLDLQATLNYSHGHEWGLFNFYAADTYGKDNDINVQDIVSTVNILLAQDNGGNANANAKEFVTDNLHEGEAYVSVEDGQIVLYTTRPVAALDLRLAGIEPEKLRWNTDALGFSIAASEQIGGTHAIIYSVLPREIEAGRTVLATFDDNVCPYLSSAVLSDSKARSISMGNSVPTGISSGYGSQFLMHNEVYDLQGRKVNGWRRKGMYIENGKKVVIK